MDNADSFAFLENEEIYEAVVLRGIMKATASIEISTANVKDIRVLSKTGKTAISITKLFRDIARKGVKIRLLHSGVPSSSFMESFKKYELSKEDNFQMRRCPRVHFKCVIIDNNRAYIGSANLTGAGFGAKSPLKRNFETGVLTEHPFTIQKQLDLFENIFSGKNCSGCKRKNICYVPLEKPEF